MSGTATVTGANPSANAFIDIHGLDEIALAKTDTGLPADISQAFSRIVAESGNPAMQGLSLFSNNAGLTAAGSALLGGSAASLGTVLSTPTLAGGPWPATGAATTATAVATPAIATGETAQGAQAAPTAQAAQSAPPRMSDQDIQAHLRTLMPQNDKSPGMPAFGALRNQVQKKEALKNIDKEINDPATPPELKDALTQLKATLEGNKPPMTESQMGALSVLQRHEDACPIKDKDLQKKIDDPKTPPDLKQALIQLRDDPTLHLMLDTAKQGGNANKADGVISNKDIEALSESPAMKEFNEKKAATYTQNYIPSDADPSVKDGREITENDAMRELYLYSDNLPKKLDKETLQKIVDGDAGMKKCPPQVIAAAKFMLDHPESWSRATENRDHVPSKDGSISRGDFLNNVSKNINLNEDETEALQTIGAHRDVFLKGAMTRDSLKKLVADPNTAPEDKKAAQKLLDDPLLFGMLDNGLKGHSPSAKRKVDDGKIGAPDFDAFMKNLTTKGQPAPVVPKTHPATTPAAASAINDMAAGEVDDPEIKKKKGGSKFLDFLHSVGNVVLKIGAVALHIVSGVLSVLDKIPGIGQLLVPLVVATEAVAGGLDVARTALNGGDVKNALKNLGLGVAGSAVAAVTLPGVGAAVVRGAEKVAENVGVRAAETGAQRAATTAATRGGERGVTTTTTQAGERGGERVAEQSTRERASEQLRDEVVETAAGETTNAVVTQVQTRRQQQQQRMPEDAASGDLQSYLALQASQEQQGVAEVEQYLQARAGQTAA